MRYELGFYIPEDSILLSHRREDLKSYNLPPVWCSYSEELLFHFSSWYLQFSWFSLDSSMLEAEEVMVEGK
jgi:hypothetical protein